jgi:hypothetical protein
MPIYHNCQQRSAEWFILRLGRPTASDFDRIVTPTGKLSKQAPAYMHKLLAEQMLGRVIEEKPYQSEWMERGERLEESAVKAYEMLRNVEVQHVGFVTVASGRYGCSPDGLTSESGLELKVPKPNTMMSYLLDPASLAEGYAPQIQGCMMICERDHWDPFAYHEEMPPVLYRIDRDEKYIAILKDSLEAFCDLMAERRAHLEAAYGKFPEPVAFDPGAKCEHCLATYESRFIGDICGNCMGTIVAKGAPGALGVTLEDLERSF